MKLAFYRKRFGEFPLISHNRLDSHFSHGPILGTTYPISLMKRWADKKGREPSAPAPSSVFDGRALFCHQAHGGQSIMRHRQDWALA
jgi:hypothetical protein